MNEPKQHHRVAIIIPTYNGQQYIEALFESITQSIYPKNRLGIFVVDNNSTDGTRAVIARHRQGGAVAIQTIQNIKNEYFAKAVNQGSEAAIRDGYEYLFLLNQDTTIEPDCISMLVEVLTNNKNIAVAQARMMLPGGDRINSLGNAIHYLGFGFSNGNGQPWPFNRHSGLDPESKHSKKYKLQITNYQLPAWPITYASGGAMMVSSETWMEFSGLDETLQMYHEDLDFGWRLLLAGKQCVCVRDAVVYHDYTFNPAPYKYYFMERNRMIVLLTHYQLWTLVLITPMALLMELGIILFSLKNGWAKEKFRSYRDALILLPKILENRKKSLGLRKIEDREILKRMGSAIQDQPVNNFVLNRMGNPILAFYYQLVVWLT